MWDTTLYRFPVIGPAVLRVTVGLSRTCCLCAGRRRLFGGRQWDMAVWNLSEALRHMERVLIATEMIDPELTEPLRFVVERGHELLDVLHAKAHRYAAYDPTIELHLWAADLDSWMRDYLRRGTDAGSREGQ